MQDAYQMPQKRKKNKKKFLNKNEEAHLKHGSNATRINRVRKT